MSTVGSERLSNVKNTEDIYKVFLSDDKAVQTAKVCRISRREVFNICKEVSTDREGTADQEKKEKKVTGRQEIRLDSFDQTALSRLILGFYLRNPPELPTVDKIYSEELNRPGFPPMSRVTLHKWVIKLGFVCKKRNIKLKVYQRMDIVVQRQIYLRKLRDLRASGYKIFL